MELRASSSRVAVTVMPSHGSMTGGGGGVCAAAGATATTRPETNARLPTCRRMASPYDPLSEKHRYNITSCPVNPDAPIAAAVLLQDGDACLGQQIVLCSDAAAHANGADNLTANHQRIAAARGDHVTERRQIVEARTLADQVFKSQRRAAIARRRACLVLGNRDRRILAIVHFLEIDQVAGWPDDGDAGAVPFPLRCLGGSTCGG